MHNALTLISLILPIFLVIFIGILLKQFKIINDEFNRISSKIIFNVALPLFLFKKLIENNYTVSSGVSLIVFALVSTFIFFIFLWIISSIFKLDENVKGVFIQGSFRGNYAIIGLALISSVLNQAALVKAALLLAFVLPTYNLLSVIALSYPSKNIRGTILKDVILNPLVIAVIVSFTLNSIGFQPPDVINSTITYLANLTLPLALLSIGSSLTIDEIKKISSVTIYSTVLKLIIQPLIFIPIAFLFNFSHDEIIILFIFFSCPTAIVSYIMASAMNRDSKIAGNIIAFSTLLSIVTITIGLFILMI